MAPGEERDGQAAEQRDRGEKPERLLQSEVEGRAQARQDGPRQPGLQVGRQQRVGLGAGGRPQRLGGDPLRGDVRGELGIQ
jgi:hypothetical protein